MTHITAVLCKTPLSTRQSIKSFIPKTPQDNNIIIIRDVENALNRRTICRTLPLMRHVILHEPAETS